MQKLLQRCGAAVDAVSAWFDQADVYRLAAILRGEPSYKVFTTQYDEIVLARDLFSPDELSTARTILDRQIAAIEQGLSRDESLDLRGAVVTVLVDQSGSLRSRNKSYSKDLGWADGDDAALAIAACIDIATRRIEAAGGKVEILGYTTVQWQGGQSRRDWRAAGSPRRPGRLNDLRHIIYKSADTPHVDARFDLAAMLSLDLLKENVDGEAVAWAYQRLLGRSESQRILIVISDGVPADDATLMANDLWYLYRHLKKSVREIARDRTVQVAGIGIENEVGEIYDLEPRSCIAVRVNAASDVAEAIGRAIKLLKQQAAPNLR